MNEQEFAELSAAAALHALSPDDERRFRAALAAHPEWQEAARRDADTAGLLALPVAAVSPPDGIRSALLDRIAETPQTPPEDEADVARPARRGLRTLFALAACIALLVGAGVGAVLLNGYLNRPAAVVALEQIEGAEDAQQVSVALDAGGTATAHWSAALGKAVLVTDGITTPDDGHTYELWFVRGDAAVSAGTFSVDDGDATTELQGRMQPGDAIAVTVEPAGGSPTGAPTSDPVLVIPTT